MGNHVFLSYSRSDSAYAERLVAHLAQSGIQVWADPSLDPGESWAHKIRDQIDDSAAVIVLMSPAFEASEWSEREIGRAEAKGKPIFPLLLAGEPFFRLGNLQHEDVSDASMPSEALTRSIEAAVRSQRPESAQDLNLRAVALWEDGNHEDALEVIGRAIELEPTQPALYANRSLILKSMDSKEEALQDIDRAIAMVPTKAMYHYNRGLNLAALGRFDEAVTAYDRAIELDPNRAPYHYRRANTLGELGRYEEAVAAFDRTLELDPGNEKALQIRQRALKMIKP